MHSEHVLHVVAADYEKPYLMSTATVIVEVMNINDSPVMFNTGQYFASGVLLNITVTGALYWFCYEGTTATTDGLNLYC